MMDNIAINLKAHKLLGKLLEENPKLKQILSNSKNAEEAKAKIKDWALLTIDSGSDAYKYYKNEISGSKALKSLQWKDYASIRILDYIDNSGRIFKDLNLRGKEIVTDPFKVIWLGFYHGTGFGTPDFFEDMIELFRQFCGKNKKINHPKRFGKAGPGWR